MQKLNTFFPILVLGCLLLTSCFKDEAPNTECDILEAWVPDDYRSYFSQPTDMRVEDVPSGEHQIVFTVRVLSVVPELPVEFRLTPGATIEPANGSLQDFSKGPVTYTVTSEDGQWKRQYQVELREMVHPSNTYDFEHFDLNEKPQFYVWYEQQTDGSRNDIWATGNLGYSIAKGNAPIDDYPSVAEPNGYDGYCVKLTTRNTGSWGKTFRKPIAAGNLFFGKFNSQYALTNTLKCTEMGIPFTKEPIKVSGYYKFKPGDVFTDKDFKEIPGRQDEPDIYSVLYVNHDAEGNSVVLHGDDVLSSPLIVRKARVKSLPSTDQWTPFEMVYEGTTPIDADLLSRRGYSLALVFSSSKTGDAFEGAVGSTLYIDKVKIDFQSEEEVKQ